MQATYHNFIYPTEKKFRILLIVILTFGVFFRVFHFFYNRSLWIDEVYLASSLVKYNFAELITSPLLYQQKAPIGFLLAVKLIVYLFGNSEIYLRTFPLVCGIAAMFFFVPVVKHFLKGLAAVLAISILCFSPAIIYHSVEIKQYSTDLLATVFSIYVLIKLQHKRDLKNLLLWAFFGAVTVWFSYASIFVLAGFAIYITVGYLLKKDYASLKLYIIPFSIWLISFAINYLLFTHKHAESKWIVYWFQAYNNFMPFPPKSLADLAWFPINFYRMLDYPLGLLWNFTPTTTNKLINVAIKMPFLPIIFIVMGIYAMIKNRKSAVLILPILITLLASGLKLYPLTERFWVFLAPIFILCVAKGFELFSNKTKSNNLIILAFIFIVIGPAGQATASMIKPDSFYVHKKSFQKEGLEFVDKNFKKGDVVYVYWNDAAGYLLYKEMYPYKFDAIVGKDKRMQSVGFNNYYKGLETEFNQLNRYKRFWIILNKQFITDIGDKIDEPAWYYQPKSGPNARLIQFLSQKNQLIKTYEKKDIGIYLFITKNE